MAEKTETTAGALSRDDVVKIFGEQIASALKPINDAQAELTKNLGVIADTMKADKAAGKTEAAKTLTEADLNAQVAKLLDEKLGAFKNSQETSAARDAFIAQRMAKFPAAYRAQIGDDPAKFEEQLKAVQTQYEKDFKAAGGKTPDVAAPGTSGGAPSPTLDPSKLTPKQFAEQYLPKVPGQPVAQAA